MTTIEQKQLFDEIDMWPIDVKTKLVEKLLHSINRPDPSVENAWIEEIGKRRESIEKGDVLPVDGKEVFQKIQQRFSRS